MRGRPWWRRRVSAQVVDVAIAAATVSIACLVGTEYFPRRWGPDPVAYGLTVMVFLPLAMRRRAPVLAWTVSTSALAGYLAAGYDQLAMNFWGPVLTLYTVASLRPPKVTAGAAAITVPVLFWAAMRTDLPWHIAVGESVGMPLIAWVIGNVGRELAVRNGQLADLTEQLRVEQRQRTERAVTEERVRIARELHDIVAHHMSVIAVQTGLAGYVFDTDPPTARAALDTVGDTSRKALQEMRRLLVLLRTDEDEDERRFPHADLAHLPELVDRVRATGLPVTLEIDEPAVIGRLPAELQLCAYRVVQEALTNVIKHAGLTPTRVVVRREDGLLTVRVTNERGGTGLSDTGTRHGLINMRERAALYGGTLVAGPHAEGGFEVELALPVAAGTAV